MYRVLAGIRNAHFEVFSDTSENTVHFLRAMMQDNIVEFTFSKENGQRVTRRGTLHPAYTSPYFALHPSAREERYIRPNVLNYWDITQSGWRSCLAERIIGYYSDMEHID